MAFMATCGLISITFPDHKKSSNPINRLAMEVPVASQPEMRRLPGRDGSADPAKVDLVQPAPAVQALSLNGDSRNIGRAMNALKFGDAEWPALNALWTKESHWNPNARNPSSGACGIPQALPCSKIPNMSTEGQIAWGLSYIKSRYGTPGNAWRHETVYNWY